MNECRPLEVCRALDYESTCVWPAFRDDRLGAWTLRFGEGAYGRSNSVQTRGDPGVNVEVAIVYCEAAYRAEGLPCLFRIPEFGDWVGFDAFLAARGYEYYNQTEVQIAGLGSTSLSDRVEFSTDPDDAWLGVYLEESGRGADVGSPAARLMKRVAEPRRFARIIEEGQTVAVGLGAMYNSTLWIFGMGTRAHWRRRGYATLIAGSLMAWACAEGATQAALQVTPENLPATAVYEKLGFRRAYVYHYRRQVVEGLP